MSTSTAASARVCRWPHERSRTLLQDTAAACTRIPFVLICVAYLVLLLVVALFPSFFAPLAL